MKPTKRVPLAPGQPMPALDEFLRPFHVHFARSEATHALERYLTGMFTEHPNKNCDTLAQVVPDTSEQSLQGLLTAMRWDEDDLNQQRVQDLLALPTEGDAALVFDDTGFAKQGHSSVGVARQYSGTLGKVGNCQVTVNCHYAERTLAWPVATRLYLPKDWPRTPSAAPRPRCPRRSSSKLSRRSPWIGWTRPRPGACPGPASWPTPTTVTTPTSWLAWRNAASATWSPFAATSR